MRSPEYVCVRENLSVPHAYRNMLRLEEDLWKLSYELLGATRMGWGLNPSPMQEQSLSSLALV